MRTLVLLLALPACDVDRLPVGCAGQAGELTVKIDGVLFDPVCGNTIGSGQGTFVTDVSLVGYDSPDDPSTRTVLTVSWVIAGPMTQVIDPDLAFPGIEISGPDYDPTMRTYATSGQIVILDGEPDWRGTFEATLSDGTELTDGELAFRYPD